MKFGRKWAAPILSLGLAFSSLAASSAWADGHGSTKDSPSYSSKKFYGHLFGGVTFEGEADTDGIINGARQTVDTELDTGFNIGGAIGIRLGNFGGLRPRFEVEVSYRDADVDRVEFSGNAQSPEINVAGDISQTFIFANLLFDLPVGGTGFTPYIGGGLGVAFTDQDFRYGNVVRVPDSDESFAAQLIGGVAFDIGNNMALTLDGRYTVAFDVDSRRIANGTNTGTISGDIDSFSINAGLRIGF